MNIVLSPEIQAAAPGLRILKYECKIHNTPTPDALWQQLQQACAHIRASLAMPEVNKRPAIAATRAAYKACGKEPNRYRPSAEALARRAVKGLDLYRTLTAIDFINLVSIVTGHSIGGFDADKIEGDTLTLGIGRPGEPFQAIGRGDLNIECLPVYRDAAGPIGTPTSDCERTKLTPSTSHLLMIVNVYDTAADLEALKAQIDSIIAPYIDK